MSRNRRPAAPGSRSSWPRAACASRGRTAWAPIPIASACSAIPTPNCAGWRPARSPASSSPAALIQFWMKAAAERGLRYSYCITSGNEPDLGLADYLNFVIDDPETRQVVLFIEGIRRPEAFMHAAGRAHRHGQADPRHQDRRDRAIAGRLAVPHRRHRRRLSPPISRCASATASSTIARSTISSKPRSPSRADGCRRARASASSPPRAEPSICSTTTPRPKARRCPTSPTRPRRRSCP